MNNEGIIYAWRAGKQANTTNLMTDGNNLYSYKMRIGITVTHHKVALDYTGANAISAITSKHVALASCVADITV